MKAFVAKALMEAMDAIGVEYSAYPDYSGRGMYGKTTDGITVGDWGDLVASAALASVRLHENYQNKPDDAPAEDYPTADQFAEELQSLRWDNMGRDMIVY